MVDARRAAAPSAAFAMLVLGLVAVIAACGGVLYWTMQSASRVAVEADKPLRDYLTKTAAMTTGVLVLTLVILFGVVVHYLAGRMAHPEDAPTPTTFESAWSEAGRRLKPEDAPPVEGFEDEREQE